MNSLREIQAFCYDAFSRTTQPVPTTGIVDNAIPARVRVSVYRNNAHEVFRGTLAKAYPVVEALVGDACFRSLAATLRQRNPSRSGDLQDFLGTFPALLGELYDATDFAYLADVATLELSLEECLLAKNTESLPLERLSNVAEDALPCTRLELAPSLRIIRSAFPLLRIWRAHQSVPVPPVDMSRGGENVGILRRGSEAELRLLDDAACTLARLLGSGRTLGEALDSFAEIAGHDALSRALHSLFHAGYVTGIDTP